MSVPIMKTIPGYPHYKATEDGRIWSEHTHKFLSQQTILGYKKVKVYKNGKPQMAAVHRLVAFAFIPNPYDLPCINHKDEDKTNNRVDNLEWCTVKYNDNYGTRNERIVKNRNYPRGFMQRFQQAGSRAHFKKVICVETGEVFESIKNASIATGANQSRISIVAKKGGTSGGYHWKYA